MYWASLAKLQKKKNPPTKQQQRPAFLTRLCNQPAGKHTLIACVQEVGWGTGGARCSSLAPDRLHSLLTRDIALRKASVLQDKAFPRHFSSTLSSSEHLLMWRNTSRAHSWGRGVCGHNLENSHYSQVTVPKNTSVLLGSGFSLI